MSDTTTATPAGPGTGEEAALARITSLLDDSEVVTEEETPETEQQEEGERADPGEEPDLDTSDDGEAEPDAEAEEKPALPETLDALAESLGVESEALLSALKAKVKVDGREEAVTLDEALRGYQREADYSRKTSKVAERERNLDAAEVRAMEQWEARLAEANRLASTLEQDLIGASEEELNKLLDDDPYEYTRRKAQFDQKRAGIEEARRKIGEAQEQLQREKAQKTAQYRQSQQAELLNALPDLKDPAKRAAFEGEMTDYLTGHGYTEKQVSDFVNGPFHHAQIVLIDKAMRYDKWRKAQSEGAKKVVKKAPKTLKPGPSRTEGESDVRAKQRASIRKGSSQLERQKRAAQFVAGLLE